MAYNLDDMIKESGSTPEQIAQGVKEMDQEAEAYQRFWEEDKAKPAEEWERKDFDCFTTKNWRLDNLATRELRALFLEYKGSYQGAKFYSRVPSLRVWKARRPSNPPHVDLAVTPDTLKHCKQGDMAALSDYRYEAVMLGNIWRNL